MRKIFITLISAALCSMAAQVASAADLPAVRAFVSAPDTLMRILPRNTRLDMVDYYNSAVQRPSDNALGGKARIVSADSMQVSIELAGDVKAQIALLPWRGDTIVAYIETLCTPVPDSEIRYFTTDWYPAAIRSKANAETLDPWLRSGVSKAQRAEILNSIPFMLASAEYDPLEGAIVLTNNMKQYFGGVDTPAWLEYLRPTIVLRRKNKEMIIDTKR